MTSDVDAALLLRLRLLKFLPRSPPAARLPSRKPRRLKRRTRLAEPRNRRLESRSVRSGRELRCRGFNRGREWRFGRQRIRRRASSRRVLSRIRRNPLTLARQLKQN